MSVVTWSHEHVALGVYRSVEVFVVTGSKQVAPGVCMSVEVSVVTWSHEHLALGVDMSV